MDCRCKLAATCAPLKQKSAPGEHILLYPDDLAEILIDRKNGSNPPSPNFLTRGRSERIKGEFLSSWAAIGHIAAGRRLRVLSVSCFCLYT